MSFQLSNLSSSSRGNASAVLVGEGASRRLFLIDAGLSPRRTHNLLAQVGLARVPIEGVLLTHLDHDHWHSGWLAAMPDSTTVHVHRSHRGRADRAGLTYLRTNLFDHDFELAPGVVVRPVLNAHDDLGTAAFRIEHHGAPGTASRAPSLGFATDIGTPTRDLIQHLQGVDVLAVESNYCPRMQLASNRPQFLKDRIMGGAGHLSNQQSARLVRDIAPQCHVLLLHLSLECNTPEVALRAHDWINSPDAPACTVANWDAPSGWIEVKPSRDPRPTPAPMPRMLWDLTNAKPDA